MNPGDGYEAGGRGYGFSVGVRFCTSSLFPVLGPIDPFRAVFVVVDFVGERPNELFGVDDAAPELLVIKPPVDERTPVDDRTGVPVVGERPKEVTEVGDAMPELLVGKPPVDERIRVAEPKEVTPIGVELLNPIMPCPPAIPLPAPAIPALPPAAPTPPWADASAVPRAAASAEAQTVNNALFFHLSVMVNFLSRCWGRTLFRPSLPSVRSNDFAPALFLPGAPLCSALCKKYLWPLRFVRHRLTGSHAGCLLLMDGPYKR